MEGAGRIGATEWVRLDEDRGAMRCEPPIDSLEGVEVERHRRLVFKAVELA